MEITTLKYKQFQTISKTSNSVSRHLSRIGAWEPYRSRDFRRLEAFILAPVLDGTPRAHHGGLGRLLQVQVGDLPLLRCLQHHGL